MKTIEYRILFSGVLNPKTGATDGNTIEELARVPARDINAGYAKALKVARCPLGNGRRREIISIEFWQVV